MLVPLCVACLLVVLAVAVPRTARTSATTSLSRDADTGVSRSMPPEHLYASGLATSPGAVTVAGTGAPGFSGDGALASGAELNGPSGIAEDRQGDLFIADSGNCRVREVPAHTGTQFSVQMQAGHIYTVAGGACGTTADKIGFPSSLAVDSAGDLFISDATGDEVLELPATSGEHLGIEMSAGELSVVAGDGVAGSVSQGQPATSAGLNDPQGISVDAAGDLLIADTANCDVTEVASHDGTQWGIQMLEGHIYRIAGTGACGQVGDGGSSATAELWDPVDVAVGPAGDVAISDAGAEEVLDLAPVAGTYYGVKIGDDDLAVVAGVGSYGPYLIDGLSATGQTAGLNSPSDIAVSPSGDLLISDTYSSSIREVPSRSESERGIDLQPGDMYTVAGALPTGPGGASTNWVEPHILFPVGIALTPSGSVVYADQGANIVRVLAAQG
jgi:trimeric autotransporter adhesin